jgi:DNA-binding Xre family transcriptional regulator
VASVESRWRDIGQRIAVERSRRWRTRKEFATATGLHPRTIEDIENAKRTRFRPTTLAAIEEALSWEPGAIITFVEGGPIRTELDPALRAIHDAWPALNDQDRAAIAQLAVNLSH